MSIGDPMTSTIPAVGTSGTTYATQVDAFLTEVKALLEAQVPMASLLIDTLDMQNNEIQNVGPLGLYEQVNAPTTLGTLQNYGGELYWVNASGAVQITDGTGLTITTAGGITGDYGGVNPAQWRFDDADQAFYGYDDYGNAKWAHVRARDFGIYGAYGGTTRLTLTCTPASSYTITFPTAAPASQSLVQMSTSGTISASNTIAQAVTVSDLGFSSARTVTLGGSAGQTSNSGSPPTFSAATNVWTHGTSTTRILFQIPLVAGDRITSWSAYLTKTSGSGTVSAELYEYTLASGARSQVGATVSNSAAAPGDITLNASTGLPVTIASDKTYFLAILPSGTTGDYTNGISIIYDRVV